MPRSLKLLLRFGGILVIGIAVFSDLPGLWALLLGAGGAVMFFSSGPT
jgi:hypothetical protein